MKHNVIIFFTLLFSLFFSYSTTMANEEAIYEVVHKHNDYEIRLYQDRLIIQTVMDEESGAFRKLFNYIGGANKVSEKIKMTIPVTQTSDNNKTVMQFYLPSKFTKKTVPNPSNSEVTIETIREGYFAVIQYSGRASEKNFTKHSDLLRQKLAKDKVSVKGFAIKATYNAPFVPPPFRRNEAMFRIDWNK